MFACLMAWIFSCLLGMGFWLLFSGIWQAGWHKDEISHWVQWRHGPGLEGSDRS